MNNLQSQKASGKKANGFSLVETLVAISILLIVTSSIMLLVNQSIESSEQLSNRLTASYLASDVIEYMRHQRDTAWLNGVDFDEWVGNNLNSGVDCVSNKCQVDTRVGSDSINECGSDCKLQYSSSTKRFGHDMGEGFSGFRRAMQVKKISDLGPGSDNEDEVVIEVVVTWENNAGNTSDLVLTDTLTAWGD